MSSTSSITRANAGVPATPAVRRVADRLGVALAGLTPTGVGGRIRIADVRAAAPTEATARPSFLAAAVDAGPTSSSHPQHWRDAIADPATAALYRRTASW